MTIYYVSPSPTGNDNNAGTSGAPFATITHAATRCVAGDTVLVNDGTYSLSQATYVNGAAGSPITYKAVNKGQAKIVGTTDDPWYNQGNYVVIDGFDITNGVTNGIHGINNYGSNVTIQNCTIHDILLTSCPSVGGAAIFDGGYSLGEQVNVNILNNTIYNIGPITTCTIVHGIYQTCSGGIIANNIIYGVCGYGIHLWHAATDQVITNNLIFAGRYGGLLVGNDGTNAWATSNNNTIVANNIFYNNTNYGFREFGNTGTNNRYINNAVFGSSTSYSLLTGQAPIGTITTDPAFVNYQSDGSGDYHLSSTSPCIGTGSPIGAYGTDRSGNVRPTRPFRYDIGPYVYLQTIGVLPGDANLQRALGVYDPTSHKVVAVQAGTTSTDGTTGVVSAPLSSSSSGSNASIGSTGNATPTSATLAGASDGTNLQPLLVESSSNRNLRIGIYQGGLEVSVTGANALKVDASATTQPISAASLPLPTGASTSAKQPALGTAGSASSDVLTVQGIASMTALKVDGSAVTQPVSGTITANIGTTNGIALDTSVNGILQSQGSTTSGQKGPLIQGAVTSSSPSYTTAQSNPLSLTIAGALRVDGSGVTQPISGTVTANAGTGNFNNASVGSTGSTIPSSAALIGGSDGTNLQALQVESSSNKNLRISLYNGVNEAQIDSSGNQYIRGNFTEQSSLSAGSLNALLVTGIDVSAYKWFSLQVTGVWSGTLTFQGSNDNSNFVNIYVYQINNITNLTFSYTANGLYAAPITFRYLQVKMTSYTSGTANGTLELYTTPPSYISLLYANQAGTWNTGLLTSTTGGSGDFHLISAATTNATSIKASAGQVYGYEIYNSNASVRYVKLYNKASSPVVGTDTPFRTIGVPANGRASFQTAMGLAMGTGIALATTTGIADTDSTAVGANDLSIDIDWK